MESVQEQNGHGLHHLRVLKKGRDLNIRIPVIDREDQYIAILGELGSSLRHPTDYSEVTVELSDTTDLTLSLAAVLLRFREDLESTGRRFRVVGVQNS